MAVRIRSRVGHLKVPSPEFDSNTCAEFVLIFKEMRGDGGEILFIALHEGHGLHELRARCGCPHVARSHVLSVSL